MFIVRTARTLVHFADSSHRLMSFHNSGHLAKSCSHSVYMMHLWQSCLPICFAYCRITFLHISTSSGVISNFSSLSSILFSFSLLLHIQICLLLCNLLGHILDYGRPQKYNRTVAFSLMCRLISDRTYNLCTDD